MSALCACGNFCFREQPCFDAHSEIAGACHKNLILIDSTSLLA